MTAGQIGASTGRAPIDAGESTSDTAGHSQSGPSSNERSIMKRIEIEARGLTFEAWSVGPEDGPLLLLLEHLAEHVK